MSRYRKKEEGGGGDGEDEEDMEVDKSPEKVNMFRGVFRISPVGTEDFDAQKLLFYQDSDYSPSPTTLEAWF